MRRYIVNPETQNQSSEPIGLAKTSETHRLIGMGQGVARQEAAGRVSGRVWNQSHPFLRSEPGPLAGYLYPWLTLDQMNCGTNIELVYGLDSATAEPANEHLNCSIDCLEVSWNTHLVKYDTLMTRPKPSSNSQLPSCSWRFMILDESHQYKTENNVGWLIGMKARIRFKLQVAVMPAFHSLFDRGSQMMCLYSGGAEDPKDITVIELHGAEALDSAAKRLMQAIWFDAEEAQQDEVHWMIYIVQPWMIRM